MPINAIAQVKKLRNKRKELDKKSFHIFIVENVEIYQKQKHLKI